MSNDLKSDILNLLAKEFEYSQSLHSEIADIIRKLNLNTGSDLNDTLRDLQREGLVHLWIDRRDQIKLAKITWLGLNKIGEVHLKYGLDRTNL